MMNLSSYVCTYILATAREKARVEMPNGHDFFPPLSVSEYYYTLLIPLVFPWRRLAFLINS